MRPLAIFALASACGTPTPQPTTVTVEPLPTPSSTASTTASIAITETPQNAAPEVLMPGRVTIVHFFASWCLPCTKAMPALDALATKLSSRVAVIGIGEDEEEPDMRAFVRQIGVRFSTQWDDGKKKATLWHTNMMPTTFIVDRHGALRFTHAGFHDDDGAVIEKEARTLADEP